MKATRFPVARRRAVPEQRGADLERERPLLLDPFSDAPRRHLVWRPDGSLTGKTDDGRVTIDVLGLNRAQLVDARQRAFGQLQVLLERTTSQADLADLWAQLGSPREEFAGLRRQFRRGFLERLPDGTVRRLDDGRLELDLTDAIERAQHTWESRVEDYSLDRGERLSGYYGRPALVSVREARLLQVQRDLEDALDDVEVLAHLTDGAFKDEWRAKVEERIARLKEYVQPEAEFTELARQYLATEGLPTI